MLDVAFISDFWEFTPFPTAATSGVPGGTWLQQTPVSNRADGVIVVPPPVIRLQSAYDSERDIMWLWHGQYEQFNTQQSPDNALFMWQWCASRAQHAFAHFLVV